MGRVTHDLAGQQPLSVALYLTDKLCEPDHWHPRLWLGMCPLQDELGRVITELRWMQHVEPRVESGMKLLAALQTRTEVAEPISQAWTSSTFSG